MLAAMHVLSPTLMILVPLVVAIWLVRRWRLDWAIFGLGAFTFIVSQVFHIPFNQFLLNPLLGRMGDDGWAWVVVALTLGLSAGMFEETARYLVLRRRAQRARDWRGGIFFGLGHGGIEAILLGILALYAFVQASSLRGVALETVIPQEQLALARAQLESYWGMAWYEPLWGTLERLSAMAFHLLATTMVFLAVIEKRSGWLIAAILGHTLFNAFALVALREVGVATTELALAGIGALSLWGAIRLRVRFPVLTDSGDQVQASGVLPPKKTLPQAVDRERMEDSKYL